MAGAPHLEAFLEAAQYFIGLEENPQYSNYFTDPRGYEMLHLSGFGGGCSWCAIFVSACAEMAGVGNIVIAKEAGAGWIQERTVLDYGGEWIEGPYMNGGNPVTPIPGDIITFANEDYHGYGHATHVGIVEKVEDGIVHTIEGNTGDACRRREYELDCGRINMYVRPDWSRVGDDISAYLSGVGGYTIGPLYQNRNDRHDMTMREVGYLDSNYKLTNKSTGIAISVINYTSLLGDLYDIFAPAMLSLSAARVNTSQLRGNTKIAVDFFLDEGFSASAACGIVGSLMMYSNLDPKFSKRTPNNQYLKGIGAWNPVKVKYITERLQDSWDTDLSGQLEMLLDDLTANYKGMLQIIKLFTLEVTNAERSAVMFTSLYNEYFNSMDYIEQARKYATEFYSSLIISQPQLVGNIGNLRDINGNIMSAKYSVDIPANISQTGIVDYYTSYSRFYSRWGYAQRTLADVWADQGFPCDKGIATIGGYYCVAVMEEKFGHVGDVLSVTLEGGAVFPAIIADTKGADAESDWGHLYGDSVSIIEWERVKTYNGKVSVDRDLYSTDVDHSWDSDWLRTEWADWWGKDVTNITNYGSYYG